MVLFGELVEKVIMKTAERKSLWEWIIGTIEEELPGRGREIAERIWERYEQDCHKRHMAELRRELLIRFPLLPVDEEH